VIKNICIAENCYTTFFNAIPAFGFLTINFSSFPIPSSVIFSAGMIMLPRLCGLPSSLAQLHVMKYEKNYHLFAFVAHFAVSIAKRSMIFSGDRLRVKTLTLVQIRKYHLHGRNLS
jgi:hypothetical protein